MTFTVRLRDEADQDLADAAIWYEQQHPGLGHEFLDELSSALKLIIEKPFAYPLIHRKTRRALVKRFPFGIYFMASQREITVVAVLHGSRHPRYWHKRISE